METEISNPQSVIHNPQSHIFLIGFMACGKSTVGPVLAAKLNRPFIDLDQLIEAKTGYAIAELIARNGEEIFRQIEMEMLRASTQGEPAVIATGGGAMMREENRELMSRHGITVWLDAPVELCWQRIQQDPAARPLALDVESVQRRYKYRLPFYRQAMFQVPVNESQSPEEIAEEIVACLHHPEAW